MKLAPKVIEILSDPANRPFRYRLAAALNFSEYWICKRIAQNKPNGPLTTLAAIRVISEETGLSQEEILEETSSKVVMA